MGASLVSAECGKQSKNPEDGDGFHPRGCELRCVVGFWFCFTVCKNTLAVHIHSQ